MPPRRSNRRRCSYTRWLTSLLLLAGFTLGVLIYLEPTDRLSMAKQRVVGGIVSNQHNNNGSSSSSSMNKKTKNGHHQSQVPPNPLQPVPDPLWNNIYHESDFVNQLGIVPAYWESDSNTTISSSSSSKEEEKGQGQLSSWGPCFPPKDPIDWESELEYVRTSPTEYKYARAGSAPARKYGEAAGGCRPGFLIIGAGKCGTSSLYHYLTGHPRVLPAIEKQIHYFKYHLDKPLSWYYSWFPKPGNFLASGGLMTGEASPGYLPYPEVTQAVKKTMPGRPKIVMVGREPIDRSWSSYRYNYIHPTIEYLRKGHGARMGIRSQQPDEYYEPYLFSFEDMILAELDILEECFAPGGHGEKATAAKWFHKAWPKAEIERRSKEGLPPLIDLDGVCYGGKVDSKILRKQWTKLQTLHPEKVIAPNNLFLTQAIIGRSLYVFPLEWWYFQFPKDDIYFVCTEELSDMSGESMNRVAVHLGLPAHNFSSIVAEGAYNVGGHRGYDTATSWEEVAEEEKTEQVKPPIPLTEETRARLQAFVNPYNERLFELTGRRCDW